MKLIDIIVALLLATSAALQFNDPDPAYWALVYGLAALVPLLHVIGKSALLLAVLSLGMILSGLIYAAPGFLEYLQSGNYGSLTGSMDGPATYVEPAREFLGLLIAGAAVSYYSLRWHNG